MSARDGPSARERSLHVRERIVDRALREARALGWQVGNLDLTLLAERPKIARHVPAMRAKLAQMLGVEVAQVGVKATTSEGLDAIGEGRGIACHAVVLLFKA